MPFLRFFTSTVGLKVITGVTGFILAAFLLVHMLGNLQVFLGPEAINQYAWLLKYSPEVLWLFRFVLLAAVFLHIFSVITLARRNRAAKPEGYDVANPNKASVASRTMMISGILVLAFIVFHILHFTTWTIFPSYADMIEHMPGGWERHDVYAMIISGFSIPWVVAVYVIAMALVSFHLSHGVASMFRSLGLMNGLWRPLQERIAIVYALIIFCGMSIIPLAIIAGFGHHDEVEHVAQVETATPDHQENH